jgi:chromosome segregation ATPase
MNSMVDVQAPVTAEANAFALMALAADPAGAKARLKEIAEATKASDTAREAAEAAIANSEKLQMAVTAARDAVSRREREFHEWIAAKEAQLEQREHVLGAAEQKLRVADSDLRRRESELQERTDRHAELVTHMRKHLEEIEA